MIRHSIALSLLVSLCLAVGGCKEKAAQKASSSRVSLAGDGEILKPNAAAPVFSISDLSGNAKSLGDFSGKVVLLNFWATWCAPCVAEMPALQRLYTKLHTEGFEVVAVNVDPPDSDGAVRSFVTSHGITFPVLLDKSFVTPDLYGLSGFPESFFLGADGKFISVLDPDTKSQAVRLLSDRPWDSAEYVTLVRELIAKYGKAR